MITYFAMLAASWQELLITHEAPPAIYEQYACDAPKIADPLIKAIPIEENGDPLIDVKTKNSERVQMLPDPAFPFASPSCNSGLPNASKMREQVYIRLLKMVEELDRLAPDFGYEPGQISIRVFEGLRDLQTQKFLFDQKLEEIRSAYPHLTNEEAEQETSKWVSPYRDNVPVHSTGAAVDIRLWDAQKEDFVNMGTFGVIWTRNSTAPTFSEDLSDEEKLNRLYCLIAAHRAGLTNYAYEFWHYSFGDRYAAYWLAEQSAMYGSVKE